MRTHMVLRYPHGGVSEKAPAPCKGADGPGCILQLRGEHVAWLLPLGLLMRSLELQEVAVRHLPDLGWALVWLASLQRAATRCASSRRPCITTSAHMLR